MTGRFIKLLAAASTLALFHFNANAAFITYTSETSFLNATNGAVTDSYNDLTSFLDGGSSLLSPLSRALASGSYDLQTANSTSLFVGDESFAPSGEEYISNVNREGKSVSAFNFSALPTGAIGGFFFGSEQTPVSAMVTATVFDILGNTSSLSTECDLTRAACFMGFSSTVEIERLEFTSNSDFVGLDDLTFANQTAVSSVPAPASLGLLSLALISLSLRRKKV